MMRTLWFLLFCIAFSVLRLSTAYVPGNETDRLALLAFKDQMSSHPPGLMSSWNDSSHFCEWGGVICSRRRQRVVTLDLRSQGLTGSISPSIGNLSFLRYVYLQNNTLRGRIPQEIGRLFRLQELYMNNNSLSGPMPVNLSHCVNLITLKLGYNALSGKIPEEYGHFPKLEGLGLHMNNFIGRIPESLGNLTSLQILYLIENHLEGSIPNSLSQLKRLKYLVLSENKLSGPVPSLLYNISSLEQIGFAQNQLEGSFPGDIGLNLPLLTYFYVGGNKLRGPIPVSLFLNSSNIQILELGDNNFTGNVPIEIGNLKSLGRLVLSRNSFGSGGKVQDLAFITSLNNCSDLNFLHISINNFGGRLPATITNLSTTLNTLNVGENKITGCIPSQIGNLFNLIDFSTAFNFLSGTIPAGIGMLQNLQKLFLNGNRLSGRIPLSVGNMTSLYDIDLSDNRLDGNIITRFDKCRHLQTLYLDSNRLTGIVPKQILGLLGELTFVSLSHNYFTGSLPSEVGNLINLKWLDISENKLAGEIPRTLGGCLVLEGLFLQGNFFQGPVPSLFGYLKGIQYINLSRNDLSGKVLEDLQYLPYLAYLDLSFNNFDGEVPINGVFQNASKFSVTGNDKLCGGIPELHLPNCVIPESKRKGKPLVIKLTLRLLLPFLIVASLLLALYWRNKHGARFYSEQLPKNSIQRVSYNELCDATSGFSSENLIGIGSFGSVYKGVMQKDQSLIAVKVLNLIVQGASKSFLAECEILRRVRHRNLLKILTVCSSIDSRGNDFKALIFKFMSNGSLENWLHPSSDGSQRASNFLNLLQRLNIAIDVATALDYLHNHCPAPIIHCDLKPSNVLLDDSMVAYVGDFGLAEFLCKNNTSNFDQSQTNSIAVRGTIGYIPPEYGTGVEVTPEGDVYSYGIMLLEMFTGKRPTHEMFKEGQSLRSFCKSNVPNGVTEIIDEHLLLEAATNNEEQGQGGMTTSIKEYLMSIIEVGVASSSEPANERIHVKDILLKMQKIKQMLVSMGNQV